MAFSNASLLQWGHDKIVMEVSLRCSDTGSLYTLQWGHDKIVMEVLSRLDGLEKRIACFNGAMTK